MVVNLKINIKKIISIGLLISTVSVGYVFANEKSELSEELKANIESIELYKVPNTNERTNSYKKYEEIMELITEYYKGEGIEVSGNLDDSEYQQQVMNLATATEVLGEENEEQLIDFIKFIDYYENIEINNEMNELLDKYKNGMISIDEAEYLINLAPINSDDQSTSETEDLSGDIETFQVFANGYNNSNAVNYAYKWTDNYKNLRNTSQYGYYSVSANDCTNFVSQCLKAGGMKNRSGLYTSKNAWYYNDTKPSHTWGGAQNFYNHWKSRAGVASSVSYLRGGDVVNADFGGDGSIDQTAIITRNTATSSSNNSSHKYLTQHTIDREEKIVTTNKS